MQISVKHNPGFAVAHCELSAGESVRAEAGSMMSTSDGVEVGGKMEGGLMKGLKRSVLGGESMFIASYTAPSEGGWVDCAGVLPGGVAVGDVGPGEFYIQRGSYLCSEEGVEIDTKWGGFKNLFGGEGGFLVRAAGAGQVAVSCYGALDVHELQAGQRLVVDTGHMVGYDEGVEVNLTRAGGNVGMVKSGEGFVFEFKGPGRVMTQSRNPNQLITWLTAALPFSRD